MAGESVDAKVVMEAVDHFSKTLKDFIGGMGDSTRAAEETSRALKSLDAGPALQKVAAAGQGIAQSQEKVAGAATTAKTVFTDAQNRMRDASGKFVAGATSDLQRHQGATSNWANVVKGIYEKVGHTLVDFAIKGGQALAKGIGDSVKVAADFETSMNNFRAAAGGSLDEAGLKVEDFSKLAINLGKELPVSTTAVADAMTTLVKGGLDPVILKAGGLKSSIQFASAANMDLAAAADLSIKMMAKFGDANASAANQAKFLAETQDLLVKADGAATSSVEKIGEAVLEAGGQAKASGVQTQDFITIMAMMSDQFPSAAEAGTSYKNMLLSLVPTGKAQIAMAKQLGLITKDGANTFYDSTGSFVGNRKAAELLHNAFAGLSQEQTALYARTLFGNDAMGAAMAMASGGAEAYDRYAKAMGKANGVTTQAAARMQGANTAIENFKGSIEAAQISLVGNLLPVLTAVLNQGLSPLINGIEAFVTKSGGVQAFAQSAEKSVANVVSVFRNFFAILSGGGISSIHGLQFALETFMPKDIAAKVALFVGQVVGGVQKVVGWVTANWPLILATISGVLVAVGGVVNEYVMPFVTALLGAIGQLVGWVVANFPQIAATIGAVFGAVGSVIATLIIPNVAFVLSLFQKILGWVSANFPLMVTLADAWGQKLQAVFKAVAPALQVLGTLFSAAFTLIKIVITTFVDVVLALFKAGMQLLIGDTEGALGTVNQVFSDKFEAVKTFLRNLIPQITTLGQNIITGLLNGLKSAGGQIYDYLVGLIERAVGGIKELLGIASPSKLMSWYGEMTMVGFADGIWSMREQVADAMRGVVENAIDSAGALMGDMAGMATDGGLGGLLGEMAADGIGGTGTGAIGGALGGAGGPTQVNVVIDGQPIARAVVRHGAAPIQNNNRRRYGSGGGGGGRGINRNQ